MTFTLYWLVRAILPQSGAKNRAMNRFAWPTLVDVSAADLAAHATSNPLHADAWAQVVDLATLADRKYNACRHAIRGFAVTLVVSANCGMFDDVPVGELETSEAQLLVHDACVRLLAYHAYPA